MKTAGSFLTPNNKTAGPHADRLPTSERFSVHFSRIIFLELVKTCFGLSSSGTGSATRL